MAILTSLDFETQTNGAALSSLPSGWTITGTGGTSTASTAAAMHGTLGWRLDTVATNFRRVEYTETRTTGVRVQRAYITFRNLVAASQFILASADSSGIGDVRVNSGATVTIRNGVTAVGTSTYTVTTGVVYRFEWRLEPGVGQELRVYLGDSTTLEFSLTGALTGTGITKSSFGLTSAATNFSADYDDLAVGDDWIGPVSSSAPTRTANFTATATLTATATRPIQSITMPSGWVDHRAFNPGPANTLAGYAISDVISPSSIMDLDVQQLADGTWVVCHDTTIDALVHSSSPILTGTVDTDFTAAQWATIRFKNAANTGWANACTLQQIIDAYGPTGTVVPGKIMSLELKTTSTNYNGLLTFLEAAGMKPQTIFCSFGANPITAALGRGFYTQRIYTPAPIQSDIDAYGAAGGRQVCMSKSFYTANPSLYTWIHAAGMLAATFTISDATEASAARTAGADLIYTEDPGTLNPDTRPAVTAAFTATGALSATVAPVRTATAPFTASAALSATATPVQSVTAAFTASAALSATAAAVLVATVTAPFTATATYTATALAAGTVLASFTATAALSATVVPVRVASAPLTGTATLSFAVGTVVAVTAAFTATATFTAQIPGSVVPLSERTAYTPTEPRTARTLTESRTAAVARSTT